MLALQNRSDLIAPSVADSLLAKASSRALAPHVGGDATFRLEVEDGGEVSELVLPAAAARALLDILTQMGQGNAVTVTSIQAELTTNQAAELLNVSRPYLTKLLDEGEIPFRKVGTHHRMKLQDVLAYREGMYGKRHAALEELSSLDQELGLS